MTPVRPPRPRLYRSLAAALLALPMASFGFGFEDVAAKARNLAAEKFVKPETNLPRSLLELSYDQYRDIRFKPAKSIWRNQKLPFELQFFHPGLYFNQSVRINLLVNGNVRPLPFNFSNFDYGRLNPNLDTSQFQDIGYAGFRVHFPLNSKQYKDEILVFQGASYFRALGKDQRYGISARGLAVDTAEITGEEFPYFTEFWIEQPGPKAKTLVIHALMDSRRTTGAYRFVLKPGKDTQMEVTARLFLREHVAKLGVAPLTTMFYFGENSPARPEDYRPEVHDSDGLLMTAENGEWVWRPLLNPRRLLVTSFAFHNPRGFGLLQRDRDFRHYEDLEARYEMRPSTWIAPKGDWGDGRVELVLIPSPDETNDNVVAYWMPDKQAEPLEPMDFQYTMHWQRDAQPSAPLAQVVQTRRGHGYIREPDGTHRLIVDFEGALLNKLPADAKLLSGLWIGENGELVERQLFKNDVTGGWRLSIRFKRLEPDKPVEMRATLRDAQAPVSETWSYILPPD
jgi:periplasmic glucans biosynthesis protein